MQSSFLPDFNRDPSQGVWEDRGDGFVRQLPQGLITFAS